MTPFSFRRHMRALTTAVDSATNDDVRNWPPFSFLRMRLLCVLLDRQMHRQIKLTAK